MSPLGPLWIIFFIQVAGIHCYETRVAVDKYPPSDYLSGPNPIVVIRDGALRGFTMRTATSRPILAFLGIPFAQPPVGWLRFRDPIRNIPWNGTRDAIAQSPQCIQADLMRGFQVHGQEDCLYLNVYRPPPNEILSGKKLPVMVRIHGGAFFFGAGGISGPTYLLDKDVILVTINYRLGPFGFLSTGDRAASGNQGLKDQVLALQWVQQNIGAFGGDPNSVTLFGESAGAVSVQHHIVSPMSRGLFHRGISHSGSGMCFWSIIENAAATTRRVGDLLNCTGNSQQLVDCLRNVDAQTLAPIQLQLAGWNMFPIVQFGPVVEHKHPGAFLTETPEMAYINNRAAKVPWINGFTRDEMVFLMAGLIPNEPAIREINENWDVVGPVVFSLVYNTTENNIQAARQIWRYYMGNETLRFETRHNFARAFGDRFIVEGGLEALRYHSRFTGAPTYSYVFTYEGRFSAVNLLGQNTSDWGISHLDDLIYLVNNTDYYPTLQPSDPEFPMTRVMTSTWSNFATYGRPLINDGKRLMNVWEPIQKSTSPLSPVRLLDLNLNPRMINDPYNERYRFWRDLNLID